jgi:hypothetical protein
MKLAELKKQLINTLGEFYIEDQGLFEQDVNECENVFDVLEVLDDYAYDPQSGLNIIFNILIEKDENNG